MAMLPIQYKFQSSGSAVLYDISTNIMQFSRPLSSYLYKLFDDVPSVWMVVNVECGRIWNEVLMRLT
jgi:hypothetical protein